MQAQTAHPQREPWPAHAIEDDDLPPIEAWTLDEVASAFEFGSVYGPLSTDAALD